MVAHIFQEHATVQVISWTECERTNRGKAESVLFSYEL